MGNLHNVGVFMLAEFRHPNTCLGKHSLVSQSLDIIIFKKKLSGLVHLQVVLTVSKYLLFLLHDTAHSEPEGSSNLSSDSSWKATH